MIYYYYYYYYNSNCKHMENFYRCKKLKIQSKTSQIPALIEPCTNFDENSTLLIKRGRNNIMFQYALSRSVNLIAKNLLMKILKTLVMNFVLPSIVKLV